jgi:Flp pilus assembly protein TadD
MDGYETALGPTKLEAAVLHEIAMSAFHRGNIELALRFLSRACTYPEAPAMWHRNNAEILDRCGNSEAAEASARLALRREPDCVRAWETLGAILVQRGSHKESRACYEKAVQIEPTSFEAVNNLAVILHHQGRLGSAAERYRQALRLAPESKDIQLSLATCEASVQ